MDDSAAVSCGSCDTTLGPSAKFCSECGAPVTRAGRAAEYKQVTVLFADVVHSMDIAATVGPERLREIMAGLADCCATVVTRFGGTVDKFTGDGIMAVFGAPVALEDHAVRACLAALNIQEQIAPLAADVQRSDGVELALRIGLNSGQVIAGEIGSGPFGYTAIGDQVGMAQRMESGAPPGGVMLGESTARLVRTACVLGDTETVTIKGSDTPVHAARLLGMADTHEPPPMQSSLVGRELELHTLSGLLDRAVSGRGSVCCLVGPPGIGKSRLVREVTALAKHRGVEVFTTYCESHATKIPFHAATRLFRASAAITGLDDAAARALMRRRLPAADPDDLLLLDDLLGIADPDIALPAIDPDARRRRMGALINSVNLARSEPILYVMEDVHWIDEVSESMMADVLAVINQTLAFALITFRPEYAGRLTRVAGAQTISLAPLGDSEVAALVDEMVGFDPSTIAVKELVTTRAAGNPFFADEIVRELSEQGVLRGGRGAYVCRTDVTDVSVPATLQAAIAARIDRLGADAKETINAAAVIGSQFTAELLTALGVRPALDELLKAELIDQTGFTPQAEYAFRHPMIRAVAYESQLRSDRAELHRRLAAEIESRNPTSADENSALIAEHLETAGDLRSAYAWHMRSGQWAANRDFKAARVSWQRAKKIADSLPPDDQERTTLQIAPRTLLCASGFRGDYSDTTGTYDELRALCTGADDKASLAMGMTGLLGENYMAGRLAEASQLASEQMSLVESIADPELTVSLFGPACAMKHESGEFADVLRWTQHVIELLDDQPALKSLFVGPPLPVALALRGFARWVLGQPGWRRDFDRAVAAARNDMNSSAFVLNTIYTPAISSGVLLPDDVVLSDIERALSIAEQSADDLALGLTRTALGIVLVHRESVEDRSRGLHVLEQLRDMCIDEHYYRGILKFGEVYIAREHIRMGHGDDGCLAVLGSAVDHMLEVGQLGALVPATATFVEALLDRNEPGDFARAVALADQLESLPFDGGVVITDVWALRLRALIARAGGDEPAYRELRDRYRSMATALGFEGHMKWADEMP